MGKFLQDVDPESIPTGSAEGGFIDSKARKWYPASSDSIADKNWAKQSLRVHEKAQGRTPEGYLWYPAKWQSSDNRRKRPELRCTPGMVARGKSNKAGEVCERVHRGHDIQGIVIHTTEGWDGGGPTFMRGNRQASAHYGVERDGVITQSVLDKDRSWHAPGVNEWTIGIEHSGFSKDNPNSSDHLGFPKAQIKASAKLVARLCRKYNIPINRKYIIGHTEIGQKGNRALPGDPRPYGSGNHSDPGPYWDWDGYIRMVRWYYYRRYVFGTILLALTGAAVTYRIKTQ